MKTRRYCSAKCVSAFIVIFCLTGEAMAQDMDAEKSAMEPSWLDVQPDPLTNPFPVVGLVAEDPPVTLGSEVVYTPDSLTVFRGFNVVGGLNEVSASDDVYVTGNPGFFLNACGEYPLALDMTATFKTASPKTLLVSMESHAGTPGIGQLIAVRDWNTNQWVNYFASCHSGTSPVGFPNDTTLIIDLTDRISDFVEPETGKILIRTGWGRMGLIINFPWKVFLDHVYWATTEN